MKRTIITALIAFAMLPFVSSCLKSDVVDYEDWRKQNDVYLNNIDLDEYQLIVPDWAPQNSVYIKWHNDRSLTADNLVPLSSSTVDIKYELEDIEGNSLGNSYSSADSVYRSRPSQNIIGMWIAMTTMHVGDSVSMIIPYPSGYGSQSNGSVKPYSNLIYRVKLKAIQAYEKPLN